MRPKISAYGARSDTEDGSDLRERAARQVQTSSPGDLSIIETLAP